MDRREDESKLEEYGMAGAGPIHPDAGAVLLPAVLAGAVAAIVGGIAWGAVVRVSDYEVGIVAWVIGLLAGLAVAFAARGVRGRALQTVAVVAALAGILLGKYLSFAWTIQAIAEDAGSEVGLGSSEMLTLFRENLDTVFGAFDLLWVGLAVVTAWRMLRPEPAPSRPAAS